MSEIRLLQISHKSEKWQLRQNLLTWRHRHFFLLCLVSLVKFSYWSKFHVNIITGSRVMTIFFYKGLTTNTPVWVLHNIWRLRQLKATKFGTNVSNEMLLNSASQLLLNYSVIHFSFYLSFYCFSVIKGKPRRGRVKLPPPLSD